MLGPSIWRAVLCVSVFDVAGTGVVGHRAHGWNVNKFLSGRMASRSFLVRRTCVVGMKGWGLDGLGLAHYWVLNQRAHQPRFRAWVVVLGSRFALSAIRAAGLLVGGCGCWLGLLFGNCIVDASILQGIMLMMFCVSNFLNISASLAMAGGADFLDKIIKLM